MSIQHAPLNEITLAVLAGGEGRRMGFPKANLRIGGKPVLQYLLDRFAWIGPTLLVTAPGREQPTGADRFDAEATDPVAGQGPLRGVLTALQHAKTNRVVITTVDMPLVDGEQLTWLVRQSLEAPSTGVMLQRMIDGKPAIDPFPLVCCVDAADAIEAGLAAGRRSAQSLAVVPGFVVRAVPMDWPDNVWTNLNFPADYERFINPIGDGEKAGNDAV